MKINPLAPKDILAVQRKWRLMTVFVIGGYALYGVFMLATALTGRGSFTVDVIAAAGLSVVVALVSTVESVSESGAVAKTVTQCANPECTEGVFWNMRQGTWVHRGTERTSCRNVAILNTTATPAAK